MRQMRRIRFTKEGLAQTKRDYEDLLAQREPAVKTLKAARELGDLSENGLYTAAKARLRSIDSQLRRLSNMVKLAEVYDAPKGRIGIGSKVTAEQNGPPSHAGEAGKQTEYEIVGDYEADPGLRKISANSPIGRELINREPGDIVEINTPKGVLSLKIIKIS